MASAVTEDLLATLAGLFREGGGSERERELCFPDIESAQTVQASDKVKTFSV